jgi:hypothetical protein
MQECVSKRHCAYFTLGGPSGTSAPSLGAISLPGSDSQAAFILTAISSSHIPILQSSRTGTPAPTMLHPLRYNANGSDATESAIPGLTAVPETVSSMALKPTVLPSNAGASSDISCSIGTAGSSFCIECIRSTRSFWPNVDPDTRWSPRSGSIILYVDFGEFASKVQETTPVKDVLAERDRTWQAIDRSGRARQGLRMKCSGPVVHRPTGERKQ